MNVQEITNTITQKVQGRYNLGKSEAVNVAIISMAPEQKSTKVWAHFLTAPLDPITGRRPPISGVISALFPPKAAPTVIFYRAE